MTLASKLDFNFRHTFNGIIWSMLSEPETGVLILEVRNELKHEARFTALNYKQNQFPWKDIIFDETWWIGLTAVTPAVLLLHCYQSTENPDKKSLLAWHIHQQKILWHLDDFTFNALEGNIFSGYFTNTEAVTVGVDLFTGKILDNVTPVRSKPENISVNKPFQYIEGTAHFNTVKSFLESNIRVAPVGGVEYLEFEGLILISYYVQHEKLINYLVVINEAGDEILLEVLDDTIKGLGMETFFILSGCLFFVRNKCELVSYKIV